jgi:hypothetical protein
LEGGNLEEDDILVSILILGILSGLIVPVEDVTDSGELGLLLLQLS